MRPGLQRPVGDAGEVDEGAVVDAHPQPGVEDQDAVLDRVEDDLPLAQPLLLDLDRGVAEDAQRLGHPADLVAARGRQGRLELAARDPQHAARSAP